MTDNTELLQEHARFGEPIPPGTYGFRTPLRLVNVVGLIGRLPRQIFLMPINRPPDGRGCLEIVSTQPGDPNTGLPFQGIFQDVHLIGKQDSIGVVLNGACFRFLRFNYHGFRIGMAIDWAVDVNFQDCTLHSCDVNVLIDTKKPPPEITTTVRYLGCQLRTAKWAAMVIRKCEGVVFENTIIEGNAWCGIVADTPGKEILIDQHPRVWFEANPIPFYDPYGRITIRRLSSA